MSALMRLLFGNRRGCHVTMLMLCAGFFVALGADALRAQISPEEQARRLLEDGRAALRRGQLKQAVDNLNTIVTGFANTDVVDDALLEIGRAQLEVGKDAEKARAAFEEVARRYPQGDAAPGAYYHLGWLTLQQALTRAQLDDALAQFTRLYRLYPKSEWVPRALYAAGLTLRREGRLTEAIKHQRRVFFEHSRSDIAPAAQFEVGQVLALMGRPAQAMEEFQRLRNAYPDSEWALKALDRTTALWRLYGRGQIAFALDPDYGIAAGNVTRDVRDILVTPDGVLWVASEKADVVVTFQAGRMSDTLSIVKPRSLALSSRGDLVIAAETVVKLDHLAFRSFEVPDERQEAKPLERIAAALQTANGEWLVSDLKRKAILRFSPEGQLRERFGGNVEREAIRLMFDDEGAITALDREARMIEVFDQSGQSLRRIALKGADFELKNAADIAIDPQRNIYVADERIGVVVLSPEGRMMTIIGENELRRPQALALESNGAVLVFDGKQDKIVRFH